MLPNYSSLKVAESFRTLEALFPGRIDLGIGRAFGTDARSAAIINPYGTLNEASFEKKLTELIDLLSDNYDNTAAGAVKAVPYIAAQPQLWILGSSEVSAALAGKLGLSFSFAHFINPKHTSTLQNYHRTFKAGIERTPNISITAFVACADTNEKAADLQSVMAACLVAREKGEADGAPSIDEIKNHSYTDSEHERLDHYRARIITGTSSLVKDQLLKLCNDAGAAELLAVTITHDPADRRRSYELLADAFGLNRSC
jgi:luciferase family oxidoreductase group 1